MSHIVDIQTEVRDLDAIKSACSRLKLKEPVFGKAELFEKTVEGLLIKLPDWVFPAVCDLDSGELPIKPNLPKYSPIDVTFRIDENGRLILSAYDPASGKTLHKSIPEHNDKQQAVLEKVTAHSRELIIE